MDEATLRDPLPLIEKLHTAWCHRRSVVIELAVTPEALKQPERYRAEPYALGPDFEFPRQRLRFLVWANNYDATRGEEPVWWHARLAQRLGARAHPQAEIDCHGPRWCDGGPRGTVPFAVVHRESIESGRCSLTQPGLLEGAQLASDQAAAVAHRGTAARILAPAGSGKTRVLTQRFAHLLECGYEKERLTALAYNRRAAHEMQQRLGGQRLQIRTLHSLGYAILRRWKEVTLASEAQSRALLRSLIRSQPQVNQDPWQPYLEALAQVRLGLRDPAVVEAERDDVPGFAEAFPRYRARLAELGQVDHDEQIYGALELLLREPEARTFAQKSCCHLLVDEFQDLTPAFLLLIRLLTAPTFQVFGVGDDDQVIYGYAGASPDFLIHYERYFPGASSYLLEHNYRCPQGVVAAAARLLEQNRRRVTKRIVAASPLPQPPRLLRAPQAHWAERSLELLERWLEARPAEDVAVLARVNALLMPLQIALRQRSIAHSQVVDGQILQRTGIRSALAYWRLCNQPDHLREVDLADALRRPNRRLRRELLEQAARCRNLNELRRLGARQESWPQLQLEQFVLDLARLQGRVRQGPAAFFRALRCETEFLSAIEQLDAVGLGAAGSSHQDDLLALEQSAGLYGGGDFETWLASWLEPQEEPAKGVRLSSVHRVKGLEWPCVLIFGADVGLFPHRLNPDIEEERRVFHVALTRCREQCAILATPQSPSPFLKELGA